MKYEWRKKEKTLYIPKREPSIVDVPEMSYITISGEGNPNSESFSNSVSALYAIAYGIRMAPKKNIIIPGYFEYTVFPLEGVWGFNEAGISKYKEGSSIVELKDYLTYTVMIRQPEFVTEPVFEQIKEMTYQKKKQARILDVQLQTIKEGLCCQMLHVGSYDDEPATFAYMEEDMQKQGFVRSEKTHREIYLTDPSRVAPEKLKTTLRFRIKPLS